MVLLSIEPVLARDRKARSWKSLSHGLRGSETGPETTPHMCLFPVRFMFSATCLRLKSIQTTTPQLVPKLSKSSPDGSKILPNWLPNWSWNPLGGLLAMVLFRGPLFSPPVGLLERSWTPPGPKKTNWKRLLDGPRPPRRPVSACLGAKYPPKRGPGGSKNRVRKRSKLKMAKPLKSPTVARILMFV